MSRYFRRKYRRTRFKRETGRFTGLVLLFLIAFSVLLAMLSFLKKHLYVLVWIFVPIAIVLLLALTFVWLKNWYYKKIENNSVAIDRLHKLNDDFVFNPIDDRNLKHSYDNEVYYDMISPRDYLTYQLVYSKKQVAFSIQQAEENKTRFPTYMEKVNQIQNFDEYACPKKPMFENLRKKVEQQIFNNTIKNPVTCLNIEVRLILTTINGKYRREKHDHFNADLIKCIINNLNERKGDFYLNPDIWDSICRVERGKVTNKLRFAVYNRDGNRCRKCGSKYDLEVDHIYPISKGGKTTFENLQTLCHSCNTRKSNTIEEGVTNPNAWTPPQELCPKCGKPLVVRNGKNGKFKGCTGYPDCKYTKNF